MKSFSAKNPKLYKSILMAMITLAIVSIGSLRGLSTEYSVNQFLPDDHELINLSHKLVDEFSLETGEPILLTIQTPKEGWLTKEKMDRLSLLGRQVGELSGVNSVLSLANVESATEEADRVALGGLLELTAVDTWQSRITKDPILFPVLLSKDLSTVVLVIAHELSSTEVLPALDVIREMALKIFPTSVLRFGGVPVIQGQVTKVINDEMKLFLVLSLLAACLSLLFVFSRISAVIIPVFGILISTTLTLEFMAYMGYSFNGLSSTIIVLVTIIVVATSTHTLMRLAKECKLIPGDPDHQVKLALENTFSALFLPNLLTALTTAVGFLTLCTSESLLMRQYGLSVAVAVMIAWLVTSCLLFGFMSHLRVPTPRNWVSGENNFLASLVKYRLVTIPMVVVVSGLLLYVGKDTSFGGRLFDDLPRGHEIRESTYHIDENLGGLLPLHIAATSTIENYWNSPKRLRKIDRLVKKWRKLDGVGSVLSVPDIIRQSRNNPSSKLPKTRAEIAETFFMFSLAEKNPLLNYLTPDGTSLRIAVRMQDIPADQMQPQIAAMVAELKKEFPKIKIEHAGIAANAHVLNTYLSKSLMFGFWWALAAIAILLLFIFKSVSWVAVSTLPNFLPAIGILGFLGFSGLALKPAVATVFSIALGIAFDNTVYILSRLRQTGRVDVQSVENAIRDEGTSCLVSSISLFCGFSIFLVSYFSISQLFGLFLLLSIAVGLFGDLVFLPAVLACSGWLLNKEGSRG